MSSYRWFYECWCFLPLQIFSQLNYVLSYLALNDTGDDNVIQPGTQPVPSTFQCTSWSWILCRHYGTAIIWRTWAKGISTVGTRILQLLNNYWFAPRTKIPLKEPSGYSALHFELLTWDHYPTCLCQDIFDINIATWLYNHYCGRAAPELYFSMPSTSFPLAKF